MSVRVLTKVYFPKDNLSEFVARISDYTKIDSLMSEDHGEKYHAQISFDSDDVAKFLNTLAQYDGSLVNVSNTSELVIDDNDATDGRHTVMTSAKSADIRKKPKAKVEEAQIAAQPWKGTRKRRIIARLRRSPKGETIKDRVREFVKKGWKSMDEIKAHVGDAAGLHARIFELKVYEGLQTKVKGDGTKVYSIR